MITRHYSRSVERTVNVSILYVLRQHADSSEPQDCMGEKRWRSGESAGRVNQRNESAKLLPTSGRRHIAAFGLAGRRRLSRGDMEGDGDRWALCGGCHDQDEHGAPRLGVRWRWRCLEGFKVVS